MQLSSSGLWAVALALLVGCGADNAATSKPDKSPGKSLVVQSSSQNQPMLELWSHSCALCHVDGNAGAPRTGSAEEWGPRLAKGEAILLQHTIEGFNQMPPLGYCMACEQADFVAMIDFMTRGVAPETIVERPAP